MNDDLNLKMNKVKDEIKKKNEQVDENVDDSTKFYVQTIHPILKDFFEHAKPDYNISPQPDGDNIPTLFRIFTRKSGVGSIVVEIKPDQIGITFDINDYGLVGTHNAQVNEFDEKSFNDFLVSEYKKLREFHPNQ